jgi:hypothetical protein
MRQTSDWITDYIYMTRRLEPPTQYHVWSAISCIASCLQRKTYSNWGAQGYIYPNLYVVLIGPPAGRKGTAMKTAKGLLKDVEVKLGANIHGSMQSLLAEIQRAEANYSNLDGSLTTHRSLSVWIEEFDTFIKHQDSKFVSVITDLFDCRTDFDYATLGRGYEDIANCWLNIIGATTPSLLQESLTQSAVGGGLLSRMIFVVGYGEKQRVALTFYTKEEKIIKRKLKEDLAKIKLMQGPFKLSPEYLKAYTYWYEKTPLPKIDAQKFVGWISRRALHVRKVSMIISASRSDDMVLLEEDFMKAIYLIEEVESDMASAFHGVGRGRHAGVYADLIVYCSKRSSFTFKEVLLQFQMDVMPDELMSLLGMLCHTGKIQETGSGYSVVKDKINFKRKPLLDQTIYSRVNDV